MRRFLFATGAALLASCGGKAPAPGPVAAPAVEGAWRIDKAASRIAFTGLQTGKAFTGVFENFDATVVLDTADLSAARIVAVIDTGAAKTGDRQRDAALPGADWFSVAAFPEARFMSQTVTATGNGGYEARGTLSVRGVEKDLALPFTLLIGNGRATADGTVSLNRRDFGLGQGEFLTDQWVGYDVRVSIHIEAIR